MISLKTNFIFIHMPKTGGNSIQTVLKDYSDDKIVNTHSRQDGVERFGVINDSLNTVKHSTLNDYKAVLDHDLFENMFKFATIRNPWDLAMSYYFSDHLGMLEWNRNKFIHIVNAIPTLRHYIGLKHEGMSESKDKPLDYHVDSLIKFENLKIEFQNICALLNIPKQRLPRRNSSSKVHYSKYYDPELIEMIEFKFKEEIEYGGYAFKGV